MDSDKEMTKSSDSSSTSAVVELVTFFTMLFFEVISKVVVSFSPSSSVV